MFRNIIRIAWRNMLRNKTNSVINIAGLAIGMACVLLITLYVRDELTYDRFLTHADRIYQVDLDGMMGGQGGLLSNTPPAVGPALQKKFPEVAAFTRFYVMGNEVISNDAGSAVQKHFTEKKLLAVDSTFLQVFDYRMKEGDPKSCLQKSHAIVLTEKTANKYFGTTNAIGRLLVLDEYKEPFEVSAIVKDVPAQSTIQFDLLIPIAACQRVQHFSWSWVWLQLNTYVLLNKQVPSDPASIQRLVNKFPDMVKVQAASAFKRIGQPYDEFIKKGNRWNFFLQPLTAVHLHSANISSQFLYTLGDIKYVYIFSAIALLIIVLACVNFMNLSTAQSASRAKEVGIRKVLGSLKKQLVWQFLAEAMVYSFISMSIALVLVALSLPVFNTVSGKHLDFNALLSNGIWLYTLLLMVITGFLAGSYPAFYLTAFNPVTVLKGGLFKKSLSSLLVRNGLVVFQFSVSIALIVCTMILFQQLHYTQNKDFGLKKDNVVIIPNAEKMNPEAAETYRQQLLRLPGIRQVSLSTSAPTLQSFGDTYLPTATGVKETLVKDITLNSFMTDEYFIPTLGIQLLQGRNFSKDFNDSTSVIVTETTVKQVGWKEPLGKTITYPGNRDQQFKVIGVVRDFDVESVRDKLMPFALFHQSSKTYRIGTAFFIAKVEAKNTGKALDTMEQNWKTFSPQVPFEYTFLDKNFEALYADESRMGTVFSIFTSLSIFVACLGLFGLSVFTAERRKKEIGVRKVLGATVQQLAGLLSREFVKLVCLSALIAFPLAWWAMHMWLQDFAYRISLQWWVFAVAGLLALVIAVITVGFQAIKTAMENPVSSLRSE